MFQIKHNVLFIISLKFIYIIYIMEIPLSLFRILDCGSPSVVTNGQYAFTTTTYGSTATYTCNANYGIVGSSTILCLAAGSWDSNTPSCIVGETTIC